MAKNSNANSIKVKLVRKANELVEARYKFDIWETRVFAKMLTMLKPDDKDFQLYHIHVGELLKDFNLKDAGDNYLAVKQATKKLLSRV
ncbi:MAG: replication initiation protein, partial [Saprospiraceae bacterium]|nr:replication initiation protein [Saprospiraceae bacterium]